MFEGCYNATDGRLRVKFAAPVSPTFNAGVACGTNFVYGDIAGTPIAYIGGVGLLADGRVCIVSAGGVPDHYENGRPYTSANKLLGVLAVPTYFHNGMGFTANQIAVENVP